MKSYLIRLTSFLAHPDKFCRLSTNIGKKNGSEWVHFFTIVAATMFPWLAKEGMFCLARCSLLKCDSCSNIAASFSQSFVHGIFDSLYQTKHTLWTYNIFVFHYFISGWNRICPSFQAPVECVRYVARNGLCASCVIMASSQCLIHESSEVVYEKKQVFDSPRVYVTCGLNTVFVQNF